MASLAYTRPRTEYALLFASAFDKSGLTTLHLTVTRCKLLMELLESDDGAMNLNRGGKEGTCQAAARQPFTAPTLSTSRLPRPALLSSYQFVVFLSFSFWITSIQ